MDNWSVAQLTADAFSGSPKLKLNESIIMPDPAISKTPMGRKISNVELEKMTGVFEPFEDNIRRKIRSYATKNGTLIELRREFGEFLLKNFEPLRFREIQLDHLNKREKDVWYDELKYLDTGLWGFAKLAAALNLGLHQQPPKRILDIGTGPGHFQLAAEFLGHFTHGVDIPLVARERTERHLYEDLQEFWRLQSTAHRIVKLRSMPDFGARFDIVSAFMICFSSDQNEPWSPNEWAFFLGDLRDNHLKPGGIFVGKLTHGSMSKESWSYLKQHASEYDEKTYLFRIDDFAFLEKAGFTRSIKNSYRALAVGDVDGALNWYVRNSERLVSERQSYGDMAIRTSALAEGGLETAPILAGLAENETYAAFAVGQLVCERLKEGISLNEAVSKLPDNHRLRYGKVLRQVFAQFPPDRELRSVRHVAIIGVSYCGSTLIERILGSIPNVVSVGESVYLTHHHNSKDNFPIAIEKLDFTKTNTCASCGIDCKYLTPLFRAALGFNPVNWYQQIGDRFGCEVLVSSDKNLSKIFRHDPLLRLDALVIFKSPVQAWYSNFSKMRDEPSETELFERMKAYIGIWHDRYSQILLEFEPKGDKVFLDFDAFTRNPEPVLERALLKLGLEFNSALLDRVVPSHSIGGNHNAVKQLRDKDFEINIQSRDDSLIPDSQLEWIQSNKKVMRLQSALQKVAVL